MAGKAGKAGSKNSKKEKAAPAPTGANPPSSSAEPSPKASSSSASVTDAVHSSKSPSLTKDSASLTTPSAPAPATLSLDFAPPDPTESPDTGRTGARSSKDSLSSIEKKRKALSRFGMGVFALGVVAGVVYLGRDWEPEELTERKMTRETAPASQWGRTTTRLTSMFDFFSKPAWPELLPPPLPAPHQKPYTLLVSIDDLLVTSTWDRQHGWRTAKRPGVDYFLAYMSIFYEVVIFTTQHDYTARPITEKLDPYQFFVSYKLFRESTRASDKGPVKDLAYLNRPLDRVILLDTHPEHASAQPENAIIMKPWKGERGDKGLVEMIPFLESIAIYKPQDVRPILKAYEGKDIPREYALKEAEQKRLFVEDWKARGGGKGLSGGGFTLSSLFGGKEHAQPDPETYLDKQRREAQALYLAEQKYIKDHKDEFERLIAADLEAQTKQMGGSVFGSLGVMTGLAPPPKREDSLNADAKPATEAPQAA
ncbi:HAD-like domain-containing protein [Amylostereum chailletii]|nr:HAD-like domain-containing protein [Amylostereum chailletii]